MRRGLLLAVQFLTIVPVSVRGRVGEEDLRASAGMFPAVGLLMGAVLVGADLALGHLFSADIVAGLVVAALALMSGGFHLDGLADTFDGLAAKGDRDRRLEVMRGGTAGPIGVAAIVFAVLIKYLAIRGAADLPPQVRWGALLCMPMMGRWCMLLGMAIGRPAREDGLGAVFIGKVGKGAVIIGTAFAAMAMLAAGLIGAGMGHGALMAAAVLAVLCAFTLGWARLMGAKFGGLTGDMLGALGEMAETAYVLTVLGWSRLYIL